MLVLWVGRFEVGIQSYEGLSLKEWKLFFSYLLEGRNSDMNKSDDKVMYAKNIKEGNWKMACELDNVSVREVVMRGGCMKGYISIEQFIVFCLYMQKPSLQHFRDYSHSIPFIDSLARPIFASPIPHFQQLTHHPSIARDSI